MHILGVSALYHDSAAALLRDGDLIAAAQEERFTRIKFDHRFPIQAIRYCLEEGGISKDDLDYVVFYEKPFPKFERILVSALDGFPRSWRIFREATIAWLKEKLWVKSSIIDQLGIPSDRVLFVEHHLSHAASAMFTSPFSEAAVLTVDGVGEWTTTAVGTASADWGDGRPNRIDLTEEIRFPHSLGLLYSAFTAWLGFKVNSGEYKVMGMAPYGTPRYVDDVHKIIDCHEDGSFSLDMEYFTFHRSIDHTYSDRFVSLFGPPRQPESPFFVTGMTGSHEPDVEAVRRNQHFADVASSIQSVTEEILLRILRRLHANSGLDDLVMAGGVALNSVANGRIIREAPFRRVFIQPNAGDAGGALGAALYAHHVLLGKRRSFVMEHAYYGKEFGHGEMREALETAGVTFEHVADPAARTDRIVDALTHESVVALYQGRFEWGPRALGNRSILADPRTAAMRDTVNARIKFREEFRPFAPAVLEHEASAYFDMSKAEGIYPPRFMLMVSNVLPEKADSIAAVSHMGTARMQTVRPEWNQPYHDVIAGFGAQTGVPILLNTSFNLRGEPIVTTPTEAIESFLRTNMEMLSIGEFLVTR